MFDKYVVIDTETTGNAPKKGDKIIQIGAAVVESNQITKTFSTFVNPQHNIPRFIQQLTGIENGDVSDAPLFADVAPELVDLLENASFVAHNVPFDLTFINQELIQAGYGPFRGPVIDTVECARFLYPSAPGYKLSQLADWLNLKHSRPHQADSDALVTAEILLKLFDKIQRLPKTTLKWLLPLASRMESDIGNLIRSTYYRKKESVEEEQENIEVFKGLAIKKFTADISESSRPTEETEEKITNFFSPEGSLQKGWDNYETRPGQRDMAAAVKKALENRQHLLVEAGAGSGKSLAYLVPALYYASKTKNSLAVSTHTLTLQEQLMEKELPFLKEKLPFSFEAVSLKGRNHYLCLRKLKHALSTIPATYEEVLSMAQILIWILETDTGDVEEINIPGDKDSSLWEKVRSDETTLMEIFSDWNPVNYYYRAGEKARKADLLITNHALLFSSLSDVGSVLSSCKNIIMDEAHHLDETAVKNFGSNVNYFRINHALNQVGIMDKFGYYQRLMVTEQSDIGHFSASWYQRREDHMVLLKFETDELFRMLYQFCLKRAKNKRVDGRRLSFRYQPLNESSPEWGDIQESLRRILVLFKKEESAWLTFYQVLSRNLTGDSEIGLIQDFKAAILKAEEVCDHLFTLLLEEDNDYVYWLEADSKGAANAAFLYSRPIDVSDLLADEFFAEKDSVIMTSASLTVRDSFSYVIKKWGLMDFSPATLQVLSPYNYDQKVKLLIPEDIALINDGEKEFIYQTAEFIYHAASVTEGKMLVLFTSFDMLRKTYNQLRKWDEASDFSLIAQGLKSGSRTKLIKTFKQHSHAILLGTNAFWEGIDIPGEDLSALVIIRLPFSPPDEMLTKARMEKVRERGGNPFSEISLPQAVLRFKQGFGRLIRNREDKGVVIVLDKRIIHSRYGSEFIQSIPPVPVVQSTSEAIFNEIAGFLHD